MRASVAVSRGFWAVGDLVNQACGLTADEIALMWATAPHACRFRDRDNEPVVSSEWVRQADRVNRHKAASPSRRFGTLDMIFCKQKAEPVGWMVASGQILFSLAARTRQTVRSLGNFCDRFDRLMFLFRV
jgi:hypothetical protein